VTSSFNYLLTFILFTYLLTLIPMTCPKLPYLPFPLDILEALLPWSQRSCLLAYLAPLPPLKPFERVPRVASLLPSLLQVGGTLDSSHLSWLTRAQHSGPPPFLRPIKIKLPSGGGCWWVFFWCFMRTSPFATLPPSYYRKFTLFGSAVAST
jgi:hypothetical protein